MAKYVEYQLSEYQATILEDATRNLDDIIPVRTPSLHDSPSERADLAVRNREVDDLILLGILEDVSQMWRPELLTDLDTGRRYVRVLTPTELGYTMFHDLAIEFAFYA